MTSFGGLGHSSMLQVSTAARRIPGSRELFWYLRILCIHPVVLSDDRYTASGFGSACFLSLLALCYAVCAVLMVIKRGSAAISATGDNPIRSDMESFLKLLGIALYLSNCSYSIVFFRCRSRLASTLNQLRSLWTT